MTNAATEQVQSQGQIKTSLLQPGLVDKALESFKLGKVGTVEERAKALQHHFVTKYKADDLVECTECNGISDARLDACPFCGLAAEGEPVGEEREKTMTTKETVKEETATKSTKAKKGEKTNGTAITKAPETLPAGVTESALDSAVIEIQKLKSDAAAAGWRLGKKILEVYDGQLWKARKEGEKPKYKSFNVFCDEEIKMSHTQAYKLMDVAKAFNEPEVHKFGTSKLGLVLEAPPEAREKLMKDVEKGASKRELKKKVEEAKKEKKAKGSGGKRETGRKVTPAGKPREQKQVTIASVVGTKKTIGLYAKPAKRGDEPVRATKIEESPYGFMDLTNDVRLFVMIQEGADGKLKAVLEFKRIEAAKE